MSAFPLAIAEFGDGAVMVTIAATDPSVRGQTIRHFRDVLVSELPPGVEDVVSGLESLLVEFDPLQTSSEQIAFALRVLARAAPEDRAGAGLPREFVIPVVVNAETAPDLDDVADELGMRPDEVISAIEESQLTVSLLASAMAPMLDGLDVPDPVRRQATPRTDVPAGSVMIAGRSALIQPFPGPTGWRVLGRTPLAIVDISRPDPVAFRPGDRFRFSRIDESAAEALTGSFLDEVGHDD